MKNLTTRFTTELSKYEDNTLRPGWVSDPIPYMFSFIGEAKVTGAGLCDLVDVHGEEPFIEGYMLHFIAEFPDSISGQEAVLYQRRFITLVKQHLEKISDIKLTQGGDDLYLDGRKLSVSIVAPTTIGTYMMHAAFNIRNECSLNISWLEEFTDKDPRELAENLMEQFKNEVASINYACHKVKPISSEGHLEDLEILFKNKTFRSRRIREEIFELKRCWESYTDEIIGLDVLRVTAHTIIYRYVPLYLQEDLLAVIENINELSKMKAFVEALLIKLLFEPTIVIN